MTTTKPQWIKRRWEPRELVLIGVFAAAAKLSSLLIALAGGGMNPISLLGKNLVYTTLMIVLLTKVPKLWTLTLLGGSLTLLPAALTGALLGELFVVLSGGVHKPWAPWVAVGVYDFVSKMLSLGVSYLFLRETPALMTIIIPIVLLGYAGSVIGLWFGWKTVGELRHAGFVR